MTANKLLSLAIADDRTVGREGLLQALRSVVLAATASGVSQVIEFYDSALLAVLGFSDVLPRK